jgi:hypothetical protein
MTLSREQVKIKEFVDLSDGPSPLQARPEVKTLRDELGTILFET